MVKPTGKYKIEKIGPRFYALQENHHSFLFWSWFSWDRLVHSCLKADLDYYLSEIEAVTRIELEIAYNCDPVKIASWTGNQRV